MKTYHDLAGDGGSDVLGQVLAQRREVEDNLAGVRHLVAVGSGKGGVGKSTVTALLARALARAGWRTAVLDADFNGPAQARLAGLSPVPVVPGERGLPVPRGAGGVGVVSFGSHVPESEEVDFASVAAGDSHAWRATQEFTVLSQLLSRAEWGELDALLVDLPPGAERTFQHAEFLGPRTSFVVVTIPSALARGVVRRSLAALRRAGNRVLGCVENMSGYYCADCGDVRPLFPASPDDGDLGARLLARIPFDPELAAACDRGESLDASADRPALASAEALADELRRLLETGQEHRP